MLLPFLLHGLDTLIGALDVLYVNWLQQSNVQTLCPHGQMYISDCCLCFFFFKDLIDLLTVYCNFSILLK